MTVNDLDLTEEELEAVVEFLDANAAPHSYTVTDGPPLARGAEKLRRQRTFRVNRPENADNAGEDPVDPKPDMGPYDLLNGLQEWSCD